MIVCTGCGTRNEDGAHACVGCGRKLQSRRAAPQDAAAGQGSRSSGAAGEGGWRLLDMLSLSHVDENAAKLVRACAETWAYALILLVGAGLTMYSESWLWLGAGLVVAGGMAWFRGI